MDYQRSKAPLSLMEQLIMIFVFAFAAAICLQAFVYSDRVSKEGTLKEIASMRATEVIETVKAYHGDLERAASGVKGTLLPAGQTSGDRIEKLYEDDGLRVVVDTTDTASEEVSSMYQTAAVSVFEIPEDGEAEPENPIYTVQTAWQLSEQTR